MKTQTLNKLNLKTQTLVELTDNHLNNVNGGGTTYFLSFTLDAVVSYITSRAY